MKILAEKFEVHEELNPKLWDESNTLKADVRRKLLDIVEYFKQNANVDLKVLDVLIVGSNASYNYTATSDIDLHLIVNSETLNTSSDIAVILYNQLKTKFNADYDITIHGIEVELYIEDVKTGVTSNGIYSVLKNQWIKFPVKLTNVPSVDVSEEVEKWSKEIRKAIKSGTADDVRDIIDRLYLIRKNSIASVGEYGRGNQLFKEIRSLGLLDELKEILKNKVSDDLSLEAVTSCKAPESILTESSRTQLLNKSKSSTDGHRRYNDRMRSKVATSVRQYNNINMDKLFQDNILTVDVEVLGETDTYIVKVSYGGFLDILHDQLKSSTLEEVDLRMVTKALIIGFNRGDVYVHCSCPDFKYVFSYAATKNDYNSGEPENRPADEKNPNDSKGSCCKHALRVLSNTSWLLKVAVVVMNYIKYMKKNQTKLYNDIIYPALYQKPWVEPVEEKPVEETPVEDNTENETN